MLKIFNFSKNLLQSSIHSKIDISENNLCIEEAMGWLLRAQSFSPNDGVSKGYHLYHGWMHPYPETTGYIIETFLDYAVWSKQQEYISLALKMADWLESIQHENGGIPDSNLENLMVFDTGQVLFGFVRAYKETKEDKYKTAAIKAGEWLMEMQDNDGPWIKSAYNNIPHTYYSRVAWSLLELHSIAPDEKYVLACKKNIGWALKNQTDNGWFNNASFTQDNHSHPFTHTIAYTIRGILESGMYLQEERYIQSAKLAMDSISGTIKEDGFVAGIYSKNWEGDASFSCLTGCAQLAIIFLKLAKLSGNKNYFDIALRINGYLKSKQNIKTKNLGIRGAIAGSYPLWGKYIHFNYPNWAAKFFVDSLLLEDAGL